MVLTRYLFEKANVSDELEIIQKDRCGPHWAIAGVLEMVYLQ